MQQRVGLARAFATEAPILLMDEPFSALDPLIRTKLQDELLQLQKTLKKTIIFVSHDLEEALKIGSTITIMEGGRIVQSGKPEDIVLRPANDYVREFIANVNPLSVLTAWHVMRDARDLEKAGDGWLWLDRRKTTRFKLDKDNTVIDAERNGQKSTWVSCDQAEDAVDESQHPVFWANPGTSLRTVMLAMHKSHTAPVGLFDDQSRFVGAIGVQGCAAGGVAAGGVRGLAVERIELFNLKRQIMDKAQQYSVDDLQEIIVIIGQFNYCIFLELFFMNGVSLIGLLLGMSS